MTGSSHQELRELVSAYALGATEAEESAMVEAHLEGCADCRAALDEALETTALLALAAAPVEPPEHLREAIVRAAGVDRELRGAPSPAASGAPSGARGSSLGERLRRLLTPARTVAGLAAACAVVALGVAVHERSPGTSTDLQAALQAPGARVLQLSSPTPSAAARVITAPGRKPVFVATMPAVPSGHVYQLWAIPADGRAVSLGLVGGGKVTRTVPDVSGTKIYAVSVEPSGGSSQPTTKPVMTASV